MQVKSTALSHHYCSSSPGSTVGTDAANDRPPPFRGLYPKGTDAGSRPDNKEGFQIGRDLPAEHPKVQRGLVNHGPNLWPSAMPELRATLEAYRDRMAVLGQHLVRLVALSLELDEDYFDEGFQDHVITTRLLHYPRRTASARGTSSAPALTPTGA